MKYKEFELILSSFKCNKNCPYCTAKITKWPIVDDKIHKLKTQLEYLKKQGISFRYFIFCGNGEPSLHSYETIKTVVDTVKKSGLFDELRFQSSGNIFFEKDKLDLIKKDFIVEITRIDFDSKKDMEILGYDKDYINSHLFKEVNVRLNYVMLKNKTFEEYLTEIKKYLDTYPNIKTVSLKTLNLNTHNNNFDNPYSQWILQNALTKKDTDRVIQQMSENADFSVKDEKFFDRYEWIYASKPITFYTKKLDYGYSNIVYYGGELVDYHLNEIQLKKDI
ncbi:MAG: 4Fe-4S cluster-binding domain-containing protein [Alphaproteobacteria bacterium]|nr:4Fe-4S cluster-binding domain-containing protein [Alphaproteobacteria bacterium]